MYMTNHEQTREHINPWRTSWSISIPRNLTPTEVYRLTDEAKFSMPWLNDKAEYVMGYRILESDGAKSTIARVVRSTDRSQEGCGFDIVTSIGAEGDEQRWQPFIESVERILGLADEGNE